jgi:hypothetical protein
MYERHHRQLGVSTTAPTPPAKDDKYVSMRSAASPQDLVLSAQTLSWLATLGANAPAKLAQCHPRIVNKMALLWSEPPMMHTYLDDLLIDRRGDRRGFPLEILMEIYHVKELFEALYPRAQAKVDAWGSAPRTRSDWAR